MAGLGPGLCSGPAGLGEPQPQFCLVWGRIFSHKWCDKWGWLSAGRLSAVTLWPVSQNFPITSSFVVFCVLGAALSAGEGAVVIAPLLKPLPDGSHQRLCLSLWVPSYLVLPTPHSSCPLSSHLPPCEDPEGFILHFCAFALYCRGPPSRLSSLDPKVIQTDPISSPTSWRMAQKRQCWGAMKTLSQRLLLTWAQINQVSPGSPSKTFSFLLDFCFSGVEWLREENRFKHVSEVLGG